MKDKEYFTLIKMIEYIDKISRYIDGYTFETFCDDEKTVDATVFSISQLGELVKNISKETIQKYSFIEWNMIRGLRNRIVHDYEGIILKSIWYAANNDVKQLKIDLQKIIDEESAETR